jgi:hypothetical protein
MLRMISWNVGHIQPWNHLDDVDVALLQELREPPSEWLGRMEPAASGSWGTAGHQQRSFRTAVARISDVVGLDARPMGEIATADPTGLAVSRPGSIAAADVTRDGERLLTAVSMYATWETAQDQSTIYADASAHRIISDLSALVHDAEGHRVVAAGDLNLLYGYGEDGSPYWAGRYRSVFDRMESMGLVYLGPKVRSGVRQAEPWPSELPSDSQNVPTFHSNRQTPATAKRQLDFVFASHSIADRVDVTALNQVDSWGPSDHCQVRIDVDL